MRQKSKLSVLQWILLSVPVIVGCAIGLLLYMLPSPWGLISLVVVVGIGFVLGFPGLRWVISYRRDARRDGG